MSKIKCINILFDTTFLKGHIIRHMSAFLTPERTHLITCIAAVIAAGLVIAVLVFQVMELQFYSQAPSIWPPAAR